MSLKIGVRVANRVVPEPYPVETERFGVKISNLLGTVDADGNYVAPTKSYVLDLTGVKKVSYPGFRNFAASQDTVYGTDERLLGIIANDVTEVERNVFQYCALYNNVFEYAYFDSLEEIKEVSCFMSAFSYVKQASFKSLKTIDGDSVFNSAFKKTQLDLDNVFPSLEYIRGTSVFGNVFSTSKNSRATIRLSKVHTIIGSSYAYQATFSSVYADIYLPACTTIERNVCSSGYGTLHFAASNRAAIEACVGYDYKFGATEIYFDL